jgi:hypothetical protein
MISAPELADQGLKSTLPKCGRRKARHDGVVGRVGRLARAGSI